LMKAGSRQALAPKPRRAKVRSLQKRVFNTIARWYIYSRTKNPNLGKFWRVLVYCTVVWYFYGHLEYFMAVWYIICPFGIFFPCWYLALRRIWQPWTLQFKVAFKYTYKLHSYYALLSTSNLPTAK
jgi:hypothetical protein